MTVPNIHSPIEKLAVPTDGLVHYSRNPRRGNVSAIMEAFRTTGDISQSWSAPARMKFSREARDNSEELTVKGVKSAENPLEAPRVVYSYQQRRRNHRRAALPSSYVSSSNRERPSVPHTYKGRPRPAFTAGRGRPFFVYDAYCAEETSAW